jgi:hypothetical protein
MNPSIQLKRRTPVFLIALVCFGLSPAIRAVSPPPDGGYRNGNTAEEDNALLDLSTDTENAAVGQPAKHPNHRLIRINFKKFIPCAGEIVELRGELQVSFAARDNVVHPGPANLKGFSGTGNTTGRRYVSDNKVTGGGGLKVFFENGLGAGKFGLRFHVTGIPNPPPMGDANPKKVVRFTVEYTVLYKFSNGKVNRLDADTPEVRCRKD